MAFDASRNIRSFRFHGIFIALPGHDEDRLVCFAAPDIMEPLFRLEHFGSAAVKFFHIAVELYGKGKKQRRDRQDHPDTPTA